MASGDITFTDYGQMTISAAALLTINLAATTDKLHIIPVDTKGYVGVIKQERAA